MSQSCEGSAMCLLTFSILICFVRYSDTATPDFSVSTNTGCICDGDELNFTCTAIGAGNTQWSGTAFNCPGNGFILRHERFTNPKGVTGECNDGAIVGRSVGAENGSFTSQIRFTFTPSFNNKTVSCTYNSNSAVEIIGTSLLTLAEVTIPPPNDVRLVDASKSKLTFTWNPSLGSNCTSVIYDVASDCGSCPTTTRTPTAICSVNQLSRNASSCTFNVNSVICANSGEMSEAIEATLKAPDVPLVKIIPLYSTERRLLRFTSVIDQEAPFVIANGILGNITSYKFYFNTNQNPSTINAFCVSNICSYMIEVPTFACALLTYTSVTTSAVNVLGEGQRSTPTTIGCTNNFVTIKLNRAASAISCIFIDELDTSEKSCSVVYGLCNEAQMKLAALSPNTTSSSATLDLILSDSSATYCYNLTASNSTYEIMVEGRIDSNGGTSRSVVIILSIILTMTFMLIIAFGLGITIYLLTRRNQHHKAYESFELHKTVIKSERFTDKDLPDLNLKPIDSNENFIIQYKIKSDCSVKEFIQNENLVGKKGFLYYEFITETESVAEDTKLIFMEIGTEKYFTPNIVDPEKLRKLKKKLIGERVLHPSLENFKVFIKSTGSGERHLSATSTVLYERLQPHPLWHIDQEQLKVEQLDKGLTIKDYCISHSLDVDKCNVYLELGTCEIQDMLDVIVQDMNTGQLLTGPFALTTAKEKQRCMSNISDVTEIQLSNGNGTQQNCNEITVQIESDSTVVEDQHQYLQQPTAEQSVIKRLFAKKTPTGKGVAREEQSGIVKERPNKKKKLNAADEDHQNDDDEEEHSSDVAEDYVNGLKGVDTKQWRLFVLSSCDINLKFEQDTQIIIHQQQEPERPLLIPITSAQFKTTIVPERCKLHTFQSKHNLDTNEDNVFVEVGPLQVEKSNVLDVILMDKGTKDFFTGHTSWDEIKDSKKDQKMQHEKWRIFALYKHGKLWSFLPRDSWVLYRVNSNYNRAGYYDGILPIYPQFLRFTPVKEEDKMTDFCNRHRLEMDKFNFFLELGSFLPSEDEPRDVILMDKETEQLFTGPLARQIFNQGVKHDKWRVFVLKQFEESLNWQEDSCVWYQLQRTNKKVKFHLLKVDEDNVRMSEFVKRKVSKFENGKAFYELTESEDLLYYKEVIHLELKNVKLPEDIDCEVQSFYTISGAPGMGIKPPGSRFSKKKKMFVQSTSHGSRCLKRGTLLLYKKSN